MKIGAMVTFLCAASLSNGLPPNRNKRAPIIPPPVFLGSLHPQPYGGLDFDDPWPYTAPSTDKTTTPSGITTPPTTGSYSSPTTESYSENLIEEKTTDIDSVIFMDDDQETTTHLENDFNNFDRELCGLALKKKLAFDYQRDHKLAGFLNELCVVVK